MKATKFLDELRLEVISRSGLVPSKNNQMFEAIFNQALHEVISDSIGDDQSVDLELLKDQAVSKFMSLFHRRVVTPTKFNWNWP